MTPFFRPRPAFLKWLAAHAAGRLVYDVGCGSGALVKRCWRFDIKAIGIDENAHVWMADDPATFRRTILSDARECSALATTPALVLFCRPSHTGWVAETVARVHPDSEVLYLSKPGNRYVDLPGLAAERLEVPGLRVEECLRVLGRTPAGPPDFAACVAARVAALAAGRNFLEDD